jgi:hypothetical protein
MDTPILPDHDSEDDREHRRFRRTADVLRIVAAALAVAASLIGLASRFHLHHASPPPDLSAITGYDGRIVIYGDLASPRASKPGKRNDPARVVCDDEVRWEPTSGHWHCAGYATLGDKDVGRVARDPGGPCTHRISGMNLPAWKCVTKQAVPLSARYPSFPGPPEHGVIFGGMRDGSDFCSEEARESKTHGAWTCTNWRPIPVGFHFKEAVAAPGPCDFRAADQQTGEWSCAPPIPGL